MNQVYTPIRHILTEKYGKNIAIENYIMKMYFEVGTVIHNQNSEGDMQHFDKNIFYYMWHNHNRHLYHFSDAFSEEICSIFCIRYSELRKIIPLIVTKNFSK